VRQHTAGIPWQALAAAGLSTVLPGAGQLLLGAWVRGGLLLTGTVALAALTGLAWHRERTAVLVLALRPSALLLALCLNLTLGLIRWLVIADAFRLGRQRMRHSATRWRRRQAFVVASLVALLIVASAPHVLAGYYTYQLYALLVTVFPSQAAPGVSASPPAQAVSGQPTAIPSPTLTPAPATPISIAPPPLVGVQLPPLDEIADQLPVPAPTPTPIPTPIPEPTPEPPPPSPIEPALADRRIAVLLLGSDAGPGRSGARTDAIILAVLDVEAGRAGLFSVPRNFVGVPLPDELSSSFPDGRWPQLINALYSYASRYPERFPGAPDPGAAALKGAIGKLTGIPVDYYAMVDMAGFVRVVDALGGVTIDVPKPVATWLSPPAPGEDWAYYEIPAGQQHLNGHQALAYARSRTGTSDYDRMYRQRCLLGALHRQADLPTLLLAFPALTEALKEAVRTDVPLDALPQLAELALAVSPERIVAVGFVPPTYSSGWTAGRYPIPNMPLIQQAVAAALSPGGPPAELASARLDLPSACAWQE
jgi:LCP family protein required for cell wall assembly